MGSRLFASHILIEPLDVITDGLRQNPLFAVSTLHSFLWSEIGHFHKSIRESLRRTVLPNHITKYREKDDGKSSKRATEARAKVAELEQCLAALDSVSKFRYGDDTTFSNYLLGEIGHDDLVAIAADMIRESRPLRRILGQKYPYLFVDEAQDTSPDIVDAFNHLCDGEGGPIVGYFGDPMQQIYDKGMGDFSGPPESKVITKEENFRSAPEIVALLNAFRGDVKQRAAGITSRWRAAFVLHWCKPRRRKRRDDGTATTNCCVRMSDLERPLSLGDGRRTTRRRGYSSFGG